MTSDTSDSAVLDLLRRAGAMGVTELADETGVTATAVRQRLNRLMGRGLVERGLTRRGRGRPSHKYSLTEQGLRSTGSNYGDLAVALWEEMRAVKDVQVRRGLLKRIADRLVGICRDKVRGNSVAEKMVSLGSLFAERQVPLAVDDSGKLPVLTALACPYPDLAEQDRSVCAMERMMFSELLGEGLKLTACRLDGATCCTFEVD